MKIVKADIRHADIIGQIHSRAWRQAYADVFPKEYLCADTQCKRTQEFLESCNSKDIHYFLLYSGETAVGIVKVNLCGVESCEISSFYILDEYRNKGYGKQVVLYLRKAFDNLKIQLWVLENNRRARKFYENNGFKNTGTTRRINRGNFYTQLLYELVNTY